MIKNQKSDLIKEIKRNDNGNVEFVRIRFMFDSGQTSEFAETYNKEQYSQELLNHLAGMDLRQLSLVTRELPRKTGNYRTSKILQM